MHYKTIERILNNSSFYHISNLDELIEYASNQDSEQLRKIPPEFLNTCAKYLKKVDSLFVSFLFKKAYTANEALLAINE